MSVGPAALALSREGRRKAASDDAGIEPSVGSTGDSDDNALAETINGLFKAEVIHRHGPWKTREAVELATLEWVSWFLLETRCGSNLFTKWNCDSIVRMPHGSVRIRQVRACPVGFELEDCFLFHWMLNRFSSHLNSTADPKRP